MVDVAVVKPLRCLFLCDVLCLYREDALSGVMGRCYECVHYKDFMRVMAKADAEEDAKFLAESEVVYKDAKCLFESCLCDGEVAKFACYGYKSVGSRVDVWTCKRFCVEKLSVDSVLRLEYLRLVNGEVP